MKKKFTFVNLLIVVVLAVLLVIIFNVFQQYKENKNLCGFSLTENTNKNSEKDGVKSSNSKAEKYLMSGKTGIFHIPEEEVIVISDGPGTGIIIADKNVGAKKAGTGSTSYGNHFQWGRNKGFPSVGEVDVQTELIQTGATINDEGDDIYDFIIPGYVKKSPPYNWCDDNKNIEKNWSGQFKQGPCEEGFHVPTKEEWVKVIEMGYYMRLWGDGFMIDEITWNVPSRSNWSERDKDKMSNLLLLPLVQSRYRGDGSVSHHGKYGFYWTSSVDGNSANHFTLSAHQIDATYHASRSAGMAVRCFKD